MSFIKSSDGFLLKPKQGHRLPCWCLRRGFGSTELQQMLTILKIRAPLFSCAWVSNDFFFLYLFTFFSLYLSANCGKDLQSKNCRTDSRKVSNSNSRRGSGPASLSRYFKQTWHRSICNRSYFHKTEK